MVPLSKSGLAFSERGFESHPLRCISPSTVTELKRGASGIVPTLKTVHALFCALSLVAVVALE